MSRLMADQERRGGDGAGERDSVMLMNLAEGWRAVNAKARRCGERCKTTKSVTQTENIPILI